MGSGETLLGFLYGNSGLLLRLSNHCEIIIRNVNHIAFFQDAPFLQKKSAVAELLHGG